MASSKQETRWVLRAQSGDRDALDELLRIVQGPLYRYIVRLVGERTLAEDILQEVFILIYRKLTWLEDPNLFRAWTYRIASRESFKRLRQEKRWTEQIRDEAVLEAIPIDAPDPVFDRELIEHLPSLIATVSPASRAVLILHYLHEMPLGEVASVLGLALGTVKSRLAYGLSSLRRVMVERETISPNKPGR